MGNVANLTLAKPVARTHTGKWPRGSIKLKFEITNVSQNPAMPGQGSSRAGSDFAPFSS